MESLCAPSLKRRFPFKFRIDGYEPIELRDIFIQKIKESNWSLDDNEIDIIV